MKDNKKKIIIIVSIIALLLLVVGVTYAFYGVQTGGNAKGKYHITTSSNELVTAETLIEGLHIKVSANDMSENNINDYYGTDDINLNYVKSEEEGTKRIASISVSNAEEKFKQVCTVEVNVTIDGEMSDVLESDDLILNLKSKNSSQNIDLSAIKDAKTITNILRFNLVGNEVGYLEAYLRLKNREDKDQSYLAGKKLELDIEVEKIECEMVNEFPLVKSDILKELRKNSNNSLSTKPIAGLYRYQGTDNVNNWICFGTTENCSATDELVDKYMYRIIGITPNGELKLIKETLIKEGETIYFQWHNKGTVSDCGEDGSNCTWPLSRLFNRLNGYCGTNNDLSQSDNKCLGSTNGISGDSNIFIGNSYYEYLSNDSIWLNKIKDAKWKYGDVKTEPLSLDTYNASLVYTKENSFSDTVTGKIGLIYMYDYLYSYGNEIPGAKVEDKYGNLTNTWMFFQKDTDTTGDKYNASAIGEWIVTRYGIMPSWRAHIVLFDGVNCELNNNFLVGNSMIVRPVFYLNPNVELLDGIGTKTSPYILSP